MKISVFGGSHPHEGDAAYVEAYGLGKLLAESGHAVLTGGYIGTMEAVSRGASEAGGHVIGVTCNDIEAWRPVRPNRWIQEERRFQSLDERLSELVRACDAAIALPGGPGTLTEIAFTWNLIIIQAMKPKPLILVGPAWRAVIQQFFNSFSEYTPSGQRNLLAFTDDYHEIPGMLARM